MTSDNVIEVDCVLCGGTGKIYSSSNIGIELTEFRANNSISRDKFSVMSGLSVVTLFNIEKGKTKPHQMSERKIKEAIDSYKPKGGTIVNESVEGATDEQRPDSPKQVHQAEEEPTRRVFYQAEADDDWAEEIEAEDGE